MHDLLWSPDGSMLAYVTGIKGKNWLSNGRRELTLSRADGKGDCTIAFPVLEDAWVFPLHWAKNGSLYFLKTTSRRSYRYHSIWAAKQGDMRSSLLIGPLESHELSSPAISPSGWLAYTVTKPAEDRCDEKQNKNRNSTLFVLNDQKQQVVRIEDASRPRWSPDGRFLAYVTGLKRHGEEVSPPSLGLFDIELHRQTTIPFERGSDIFASRSINWSPDSRRLFLTFQGKRQTELMAGLYELAGLQHKVTKILAIEDLESRGTDCIGWKDNDALIWIQDNGIWSARADGADKKLIFSVKSAADRQAPQ